MLNVIFGQIFGVIATVITFFSYQVNSKKLLLLLQTAATVCVCVSYLLLGATSGFVMNLVCIVRNAVFYFQKSHSAINYTIAGLLALIMAALGFAAWQGPVSLLVIVGLSVNTMVLSMGKPQVLRISILFTSTLVLIYNIFVFSFGGIANEIVAILSSVIGIIRFCKVDPKVEPKVKT